MQKMFPYAISVFGFTLKATFVESSLVKNGHANFEENLSHFLLKALFLVDIFPGFSASSFSFGQQPTV